MIDMVFVLATIIYVLHSYTHFYTHAGVVQTYIYMFFVSRILFSKLGDAPQFENNNRGPPGQSENPKNLQISLRGPRAL